MDDKIFKLISNISTLVTFDISFIKVNHTFIGDDSNFTYFQQNLSHNSEQLNKLLIFPFTINDHLKGHFIVKAKNLFAKEQVDLIKSFLRASSSAVTSEGQHVSVLYPLADQELRDFLFILRNTKFSKGEGSTPPQKFIQLPTKSIINIENALSYINQNLSKSLSLDNVSKAVYISPAYLSRLFKNVLNINFIDYVNISKMNVAQEKLIMTQIPIIDLSNDLGFTQASYFTKTFKKWTGLTPSSYRIKNKNIKQVYTIPRTASWMNNESIFTISKEYFHQQHLPIKTRKIESEDYISSINGLEENLNQENGWIYTVDCFRPSVSSNQLSVKNKSVIQWLYVSNN